ncbi:lipase family protein [Rhodococcus koreensis]|uniref:lipase family protein n=1 Tax=Rhodococcus koreensis TaxID=99653 RepID=UPI00366ED68B
MLRRSGAWIAFILGAVFLGATIPAPVQADPLYPWPDPDPFYSAPADLGVLNPGDVVRTRRIDTWMYANSDGWQIAFRSTNSAGHPIVAVTTVLLPRGVANPPLVSYQAIVNSLGTKCAPSHSLFNLELQESPGLYLGLQRGWAVSVPDHLGPTGAYGAAKLGGMITLDSVRAVQRVAELGLTHSPVALAGYSGGGMASAWAAALAPTYAPELKLDAVVAGGIPADLEQMALGLGFNPHPGFGLAFAAAIGLEREYPEQLPISSQLNATGLWLREWMSNECRRFLLFHGAFRSAGQLAASTSLMASSGAHQVLRENSLRYYEGVPTAPLYLWHGTLDGLTPFDSIAETAHRYCAAGARLTFVPYEISEHMTTAVVGFPDAYEYVAARFRGEPAPTRC